jgi:deferrochelatase/peroxidase EfeB
MAEDIMDYHDIQGNIMVNYSEFGFIKARYLFFKIENIEQGMAFVREIHPFITNSYLWKDPDPELPSATTNIAFTYNGLRRLGIPVLTLQSFPDEFIIGMKGRRKILGDDDKSSPEHWDEIWKEEDHVHIFVSIEARTMVDLVERFTHITNLLIGKSGIMLLYGHRAEIPGDAKNYQDAAALEQNGVPTAKEHFGYSDGISNPFFKGMTEEMGNVIGGGKKNGKKLGYKNPKLESTWAPLETGEFILGYEDEAQEYPVAPTPPLISRNGSFMVYSKFHENVGKFNDYLRNEKHKFGGDEEVLAAKFVGRWRNGAPLSSYPDKASANNIASQRQQAILAMVVANGDKAKLKVAREAFKEVNKNFIGFDYDDDIDGSKCPLGSHIRRANPRGSLEFGNKKAFDTPTALDDRRRIIRRGLPYGIAKDPSSNEGEHGTIIMSIVSSIKRQFEFVFQQWLNYGNDFKLANDKDPIIGNHAEVEGVGTGRMIIQGNEKNPPVFLSKIPLFIETRGGDYFFIPSLTALEMIGKGIVDPT